MSVLERLHPGYGIMAIRVMTGIVLLLAGWAKLTQMGVDRLAGFFGSIGIPAASVMAPLVTGFEIVGGLLLIVGALTRIVGAIMIVQFIVAGLMASMPSQLGWNAARLDFLLVGAGILFAVAGAGALSVDGMLASRRVGGTGGPVRAGSRAN